MQRGDHGRGQVGARQPGEPLDLAEVGDRHDAGDDREFAAEPPHPLDQGEVGVGGEEELGDRELGAGLLLLGQDPRVEVEVVALGVAVGEGCDTDAEVAGGLHEFDQPGRVREALGVGLPGRGRAARGVAADGEDVPHAGLGVGAQRALQLGDRLAHARQVPHGEGAGAGLDQAGGVHRPGAAGAAGTVGDRDEVGAQRVQPGDRIEQLGLSGVVLGREVLERHGRVRPGGQQLRDGAAGARGSGVRTRGSGSLVRHAGHPNSADH